MLRSERLISHLHEIKPVLFQTSCSTSLCARRLSHLLLTNLLLQHDAVNTRFQQCENQARFPFQPSQRVQYLCRRVRGELGNK